MKYYKYLFVMAHLFLLTIIISYFMWNSALVRHDITRGVTYKLDIAFSDFLSKFDEMISSSIEYRLWKDPINGRSDTIPLMKLDEEIIMGKMRYIDIVQVM